ncbi:MAG: TRIC cation channel family protein, partial [Lachnospiraceae bacterium]|nr:TRIC cation channel family protein [Lachnospiraceae bacterium]
MLDSTSFIIIMDLIGTIAFAVSGAMVAVRKKMDIFGVNILAVVTATGGGVIRDLLIGRTPPMMFHNPFYVMLSAITANIVFVFIAVKHSHHKTF